MIALFLLLGHNGSTLLAAAPLTTLEYKIVGTQLRVDPPSFSVPKGVPGSIKVDVVSGDGAKNAEAIAGSHVEATLRGPSFPARRLVGRANEPLLLPPIHLVGDYQLDDIKLVDSATGQVRMEAAPNTVPVRVFDEVLVSRVTSRPLSLEEIKDKGIFIDEKNFRAVEFEVVFVLRGNKFPVHLPVVAPTFNQSTEIIPKAELEERLAEAERINARLGESVKLPPELETAKLDIHLAPINFEAGGGEGELDLRGPPPIAGLLVIPGHIGFLNQFFSVQLYTENSAPQDSRLSVVNVQAELVLPPGNDRVPASTYEDPGDDPLRFARIGPNKIIKNIQAVVQPGADRELETADDIARLRPAETGQAEFLVEGLKEGLHVMDVQITADLEGLAAGPVKIKGKAAGAILVRNPKFSLAFSHPRVVRFDEPYDASVTILNTSDTVANLVSVSLRRTSLSGVALEIGQEETVQLGNLAPGQSGTATYRMRPQRTGFVSMSNLTTSDDSVAGSFNLTVGVDERGVALSSESIGYPEWVSSLPTNLLRRTQRILGQALSVATAGRLPANVKPLTRSTIVQRVVELAEAGQRIRYGDETNRVLVDLMLDWQGARHLSDGFDQILRETAAGLEFRDAFMSDLELSDQVNGLERISARAADLAGRGETWILASANNSAFEISLTGTPSTNLADGTTGSRPIAHLDSSEVSQAAGYRGALGSLLACPSVNGSTFQWTASANVSAAQIGLLVVGSNGKGEELRWAIGSASNGAVYSVEIGDGQFQLGVDENSDGIAERTIAPTRVPVSEKPPEVINVLQDIAVPLARPQPPCPIPSHLNYGSVVAVLFSKPMRQQDVDRPDAYVLDDGNPGTAVQIQPGGRIALVNLKYSIAKFRSRTLSFQGVSDARGNPLATATKEIVARADQGITLNGRVIGFGGSPAAGVPVTLIRYDQQATPLGCVGVIVRESQQFTDDAGNFTFDFILADVPYEIAVTDTSVLTEGTSREIIQELIDAAPNNSVRREQLAEILGQPNIRTAMLRAFNAGEIDQVIAGAEGLDRAVFRDAVFQGSARIGTQVPVVLRFRGRGTVTGRVLAADGATPLGGAAVNLFPDVDSREKGRGVFADSEGRFAFYGVPLGVYSVSVQTSDNRQRIISGFIDRPGSTNQHEIILSDIVTKFTEVRGRVFERDGVTPHGNGQIYIGELLAARDPYAVATATADADGFWTAANVPVGPWDVVAISTDGRRKGGRPKLPMIEAGPNYVTLQLQGLTTVSGQVVFDNGAPAVDAHVAGGEMLVRADNSGRFVLTNVPTGRRSIAAGLARNDDLGIPVTRIGETEVEVLPGIDNQVVVKLNPRGRITGRVFDQNGRAIPNIRVAIPLDDGFMWVWANEFGRYTFDNMVLGDYIVSAPSPPVKEDPEAISARALEAIRSQASVDEITAAVKDAFTAFVNAPEARLNSQPFNPNGWGYTRLGLLFDGHVVNADIVFLSASTIGGKTVNSQGVPVGASVVLKGLGPNKIGAPAVVTRGSGASDPETGLFLFPDAALPGQFDLVATSLLFPRPATAQGTAPPISSTSTNYVLRFPPAHETSGRLAGFVFNPDGSPAGPGVSVHISLASDYVIATDTNSFFDTQLKLPQGHYTVTATNGSNGLLGRTEVQVVPGITNRTTVVLLDKGDLTVEIKLASGAPATNAEVKAVQGSFPFHRFPDGRTDASGRLVLRDIFEGAYSIEARQIVGTASVAGRTNVNVLPRTNIIAQVVLGGSGTIRGIFLENNQATPVPFAQVTAKDYGYATTLSDGRFEFTGMPLGPHFLHAKNPVTGRIAVGETTLRTDGATSTVTLIERDLGEIRGFVFSGNGSNIVQGAEVMLAQDGEPTRTLTTGPDGSFSFPGAPAGSFRLTVEDRPLKLRRFLSGVLPPDLESLRFDVVMPALATVSGLILRPDGVTPAANASVHVRVGRDNIVSDTDTQGRFALENLPMGPHTLLVRSLVASETRSYALIPITLTTPGHASPLTNKLSGVGVISGKVFRSDGSTAASGVELKLSFPNAPALFGSSIFANENPTTFTDTNGEYRFVNVPVGLFEIRASQLALVSYSSGTNSFDGQTHNLDLTLSPSGTVRGRLVRADGNLLKAPVDVVATFESRTTFTGRSTAATDAAGVFSLPNIPVGKFTLGAVIPTLNGIVLQEREITSNGQVLDLGDVALDEDNPAVVDVVPANGASEVPITSAIELTFNETLRSTSVSTNGIFLRSPTNSVPVTLELLPHPSDGRTRFVRLRPAVPLRSETTYEVVVLSGERQNALGQSIKPGPTDLVGRPLLGSFVSTFTTKDNDPPFLIAFTPAQGAIHIDPISVIRLEYNEPLRGSNYTITLRGPSGVVPGSNSISANLKILTFTPNAALAPNAIYTATVDGVRDLAGNLAASHPIAINFNTLDTLGPEIATLRLANNVAPVAGAMLQLESILASAESGVQVRYTADVNATGINVIGVAFTPPYRINTTLPDSGRVVFRATAIDRFGNEGALKELSVTVVSNSPPSIVLERVTPTNNVLRTGQFFTLRLDATDDVAVTNIHLVSTGSFTFETNFLFTGSLDFRLPAQATAGQVRFEAQATDSLGARSARESLDFTVVDATPPTLFILSPTNNAAVDPAQPLIVQAVSSDNSTNINLALELSGALSLTQSVNVVVAANILATNSFTVSLTDLPQTGAALNAILRATDASTNSTVRTASFVLPDITAPRLISVTPTNSTPRESLWSGVTLRFSEAVAANSITSNRILFATEAGAPLRYRLVHGFGGSGVVVTPLDLPLIPGGSYRTTLLPGLTDSTGNLVSDFNGAPLPAEGLTFTFTTARILEVLPTNGTRVVAGQAVPMNVRFESGLGAGYFRFAVDGGSPVQTNVAFNGTNASVAVIMPTNSNQATITIQASDNSIFSTLLNLPQVTLDVRSRDADDDGDGLPNGYEIDNRLNAFANDASQDADSDGLTNLREFQLRTDPRNADTDADGLTDQHEVAAANCLDPRDEDSDNDGLRDGIDPTPCVGGGGGVIFVVSPAVTITEGEETNLVIQVSSTTAGIAALDFTPANPPPLFAILRDIQFTNSGTNGLAVARLALNPSHTDAGVYTFSLRAVAADNSSGTTNLTVTVRDNPNFVITRWRDPVSGNWNDPTRWTAGLPGATNIAVIDEPGSYTVTLNADVTVAVLTLGANSGAQTLHLNSRALTLNGPSVVRANGRLNFPQGTLQGSGSLTIAGILDWTGGTMQGQGRTIIGPNAQFNISGTAGKTLSRVLDTRGTNDWTGTGDIFLNNAFNNLPGATFHAHGGAQLRWNGGSAAFNNAGTFLKTGNAETTFSVLVSFNNSGVLNLAEGGISLNGAGTNIGAMRLPSGTTLSIGSNYQFVSGSSVSGSGRVNFTSGTSQVNEGLALEGDISITNNATANFNADQTFSRLLLGNNGTLGGSGTVTVMESLDWVGGTMQGTGRTVVGGAGRFGISGTLPKYLSRYLENNGTNTWSGAGAIYFGNARFHNAGLCIFDGDTDVRWNGDPNTFQNSGILLKIGVAETFLQLVPFVNSGVVNVNEGILSLDGGGTASGRFDIAAGARLQIGDNFSLAGGGVITGAGSLQLDSGTTTVAGALGIREFVINDGATAAVNANQTVSLVRLLGTLGGTAALTITERLEWSSGYMVGTGRTVINPSAQFNISGNLPKFLSRSLDSGGTNDWTGTGEFYFSNNAEFNNLPGAVFHAHPGAGADISWNGNDNVFNNGGTFLKSGTNATSFVLVPFNNTGILNVTEGSLTLGDGGTNRGAFTVQSGATLAFGQTCRHLAGSSLSGSGTIIFNGGIHDFLGQFNPTGPLRFAGGTITIRNVITPSGAIPISGATINFNADQTFSDVNLSAGSLGGSGVLTLTRALNWSGGTMDGPGPMVITPEAQVNISGVVPKYLSRRVDNNGAITWTDSGNIFFASAQFNNLPGATFSAHNAGNIAWNGVAGTFNNSGAFFKTGTNQTSVTIGPFNNSSAVNVNEGILSLNGGTNSGPFRVETGATLRFNGGTYSLLPGVTFAGPGTLQVQSSSRLALATDLNFGTLNVVFRDFPTVTGPFKLSNSPGGIMTFNSAITIPGSFEIAGTLVIPVTNVTVQINGTLTLAPSAVLNNAGTLRVGAFQNNGGTVIGNAPQILGLASQLIQILSLEFSTRRNQSAELDRQSLNHPATLQWSGPPGAQYEIETSADLFAWIAIETPATELSPGSFQARLGSDFTAQPRRFLRVRLLPR